MLLTYSVILKDVHVVYMFHHLREVVLQGAAEPAADELHEAAGENEIEWPAGHCVVWYAGTHGVDVHQKYDTCM